MPRSELKSGMGRAMEAFLALIEEVEDRGGNDEDARQIVKKGMLRLQIAEMLVTESLITSRHAVIIDHNKSLAGMIAAGQYGSVSDEINVVNFPNPLSGSGQRTTEIALFCFNKPMSDARPIIQKLNGHGYRPAILPELLALGAARPELQLQFPIAALGSYYIGERNWKYFPYLGGNGKSWRVLHVREHEWYDTFCYAAVSLRGV